MGFLLVVPGIVLAITIHEYTKALVSTKLGDPAPRNNGRLTLNPMKHLEPIGFILMIIFGFGWGSPTPTSATYYSDRKKGTIITYVTPSIVNLIVGILFGLLSFNIRMVLGSGLENLSTTASSYLWQICFLTAKSNVTLALFNCIPVYPLDGAKVLSVFLNQNDLIRITHYEKILQMFLILMMSLRLINWVIDPIVYLILGFAF